jgi:hypothetical protein
VTAPQFQRSNTDLARMARSLKSKTTTESRCHFRRCSSGSFLLLALLAGVLMLVQSRRLVTLFACGSSGGTIFHLRWDRSVWREELKRVSFTINL